MRPQTHNPTETYLGSMYVREDLLRQEAHKSRVGRVAHRLARWVRTMARIVFVLLVVGIPAAIAFGLGWAGLGYRLARNLPHPRGGDNRSNNRYLGALGVGGQEEPGPSLSGSVAIGSA